MVEFGNGLLKRMEAPARSAIRFLLDGRECEALEGDTILTAILTQREFLRKSEVLHLPRAGFCLMAACQDCWIWSEDGRRLRACSTFIADGMNLVSQFPYSK